MMKSLTYNPGTIAEVTPENAGRLTELMYNQAENALCIDCGGMYGGVVRITSPATIYELRKFIDEELEAELIRGVRLLVLESIDRLVDEADVIPHVERIMDKVADLTKRYMVTTLVMHAT